MVLINRVSRMLRADLHSVLDRIEEPEALLRQSIREMEDAVADDERRVSRWTLENESLKARLEEFAKQISQLNGELDVCFSAQQTDLAKTLIRRRLETQRLADETQRKAIARAEALQRLSAQVSENRERLQAMQQKAEVLASEASETYPQQTGIKPDISVSADEVEIAFLREQQRRAGQ